MTMTMINVHCTLKTTATAKNFGYFQFCLSFLPHDAMLSLCACPSVCPFVCLSVCSSQACTVPEWLNIGLRKQRHTITTPQMHCYTTYWNVCAQKWPCFRAEWSELPCKTQSLQTVAEKYSSNDVSTTLLTDEEVFTVFIPNNPKNHQMYSTAATKKKNVATKRLRTWSASFRQSLMASVGESQGFEKKQLWYLSITESRLLTAVIVTWCCYNSYCPTCVISQASSSFFSRTVLSARGAGGSQLSYQCQIWTDF